MPTKPTVSIQTSNTQAKNRKLVTVHDTHKCNRFPEGRPWWGYAEKPSEAGMPWGIVGTLSPGNHERPFEDSWEAPWYPDAKYLSPNLEIGKLMINYLGMGADYTNATRKYYEECAQKADENKWIAPAFGGPVDSRFRAVVGRDVPQSPKIPQAAQAGDPWILGFTSEINENLARILRTTTFGAGVQVIEEGPPAGAVTMLPTDISALVASEVAKALASVTTTKTPSPARVAAAQKMRDAKIAKKHALAQANAA